MDEKKIYNEYFCCTCFHNFNSNDSFYEAHFGPFGDIPSLGNSLCPKCHPKNSFKQLVLSDILFVKKLYE